MSENTIEPGRQELMADLALGLGQLLVHVGDVAAAIRMNSSYNGHLLDRDPADVARDVMWLSDALHNLRALGSAVVSQRLEMIEVVLDGLAHEYSLYADQPADGRVLAGAAVARKYSDLFRPSEMRDACASMAERVRREQRTAR